MMNVSPPCRINCYKGVFLVREYHVYLANESVGDVQITEEGLYCSIQCCCKLQEKTIHRLILSSENYKEDLGILVPEGENFILKKKLPRKRLANEKLQFSVLCPSNNEQRFIPLKEDVPFIYIGKLEKARLQIRDGQVGITFPNGQ